MEKRRSYDARFYKPVCLIAVVDGVLEGTINPEAIDPTTVISRFRSYVCELQPDRAELGWRPFWHLSNDGAWVFSKAGRLVKPGDFGRARKPDSRGQLLSRIDSVSVPAKMARFWKSAGALAELRQASLRILKRDDEVCRTMAAVLGGSALSSLADQHPFDIATNSTGQGFQGSAEIRLVVEQRAMTVAQQLLVEEGWDVQDVSKANCFDFICRRNGREIYAEVKGSTTSGEQIILTRAEVEFARRNCGSLILIVVSNIEVVRDAGGAAVARGGTTAVYRRWSPKDAMLEPISYTYFLKERRGDSD